MSWNRYFYDERNLIYNKVYADIENIKLVGKIYTDIPVYQRFSNYDPPNYYYYNLLKDDIFYTAIYSNGPPLTSSFKIYISKYDSKTQEYKVKLLNTYSYTYTTDPRMIITGDEIYVFYRDCYHIVSFDLENVTTVQVQADYQNFTFINSHPILKDGYIYMIGYSYSSSNSAYHIFKIQGNSYNYISLEESTYNLYGYDYFAISDNKLYGTLYYRPESKCKLFRINDDLSIEMVKDNYNPFLLTDEDENIYRFNSNGFLEKLDKNLNQLWESSIKSGRFISKTENGNLVFEYDRTNHKANVINKDTGEVLGSDLPYVPQYVFDNDLCSIVPIYNYEEEKFYLWYKRFDYEGNIKFEKRFKYSINPVWSVDNIYSSYYYSPLNLFVNSDMVNIKYDQYYDNGYKLVLKAYKCNVKPKGSNFFFFINRRDE